MAQMEAPRPKRNSDTTYPSHTPHPLPPQPQFYSAPSGSSTPPPKYHYERPGSSNPAPQYPSASSGSSTPPPQYPYPPRGTQIEPPHNACPPSAPTIPPSPPQPVNYANHAVPLPNHAAPRPNHAFTSLKTILGVIAILIGIIFIVRASLQPKSFIRFNVISAQLNEFNLSHKSYTYSELSTYTDPFSYILDYNLVLSYTLRNSYKIGVNYDLINVTTYYCPNSYELLGLNSSNLYQPFHAHAKSDVTYSNVSYSGYGSYSVIYGADSYFSAEPSGGPYSFYVNMKVKVRYSSAFFKVFLKESWVLWQCLEVPLWNNNSYEGSYQGFQLTECVNVKNFKG